MPPDLIERDRGQPMVCAGVGFPRDPGALREASHSLICEFHKMHHGADVPTPVTAQRRHPGGLILGRIWILPWRRRKPAIVGCGEALSA
jgi:hypothetical protein